MLSLQKATQDRYVSYQRDELELFIDKVTGKVYASQSAMARMLKMQQGHLSSVLLRTGKKPGTIIDTVNVDLPSSDGVLRSHVLYGVPTISAMAVKYCPELAEKFTEMGATVYLYQMMGYKVSSDINDNKVAQSAAKTYNDSLETAYEAMGKLLRLHKFAEDKPGLEAYLELAETKGKKALAGGMMCLADMGLHFGVRLNAEQSRLMGRAMASTTRSQYGYTPEKIRRKFKDDSGSYQSYMVTGYGVEFLPLFESLLKSYDIGYDGSKAA